MTVPSLVQPTQRKKTRLSILDVGPDRSARWAGSSARRTQLANLPAPAGAPPHPQSTQEKGAEEHDNADEQQIQQALGDDTHDAQHHRHDHQE
jgi:hypothetical protein